MWIRGRTTYPSACGSHGLDSLFVLGDTAYSELATPPQPFNDAELVEGHGSEEDLGAVGVAELPGEQAPELPVVEDMWPDADPEEVLSVGDTSEQGRHDDADDQQPGHGSVREARGEHVAVSQRECKAWVA